MAKPLLDYLPAVLRDVREYRALAHTEDVELALAWSRLGAALADQFVLTATEHGVARWEDILGIVPKGTYNLDERKFAILTRLNEQLPYTYRMLERILTELCGADGYSIGLEGYELDVRIMIKAKNNFADVESMLRRVCPANLAVNVSIEYMQWFKLKGLTWGGVSHRTWYQLRNEVEE